MLDKAIDGRGSLWIGNTDRNDMSAGIYIHIPFCVRKCLYCDFISSCGNEKDMEKYQKALINELNMTQMCGQADSVFFGGGTPSVYPSLYISEIIELLNRKKVLKENAEITIEVNPGTVTLSKLKTYMALGINRLSIGLQSADDDELKRLGRIHDYHDFLETFDHARNAGFQNINIDLMSAIPGQTILSYEHTLGKIVSLNPEHISAYSLIIEEGTPFYEMYGRNDEMNLLPSEEEEREMYYMTKQYLAENGYVRYEISNYAKHGYECRHNLKYWSREDYYGFGIAAASLVGNERYTNTSDRAFYIREMGRTDKVREEHTKLSVSEQMEEYMFLGLRKMEGISYQQFQQCFGTNIHEIYGEVIEREIKRELLIWDEKAQRLYLSEKGIDVSNMVMAQFLL